MAKIDELRQKKEALEELIRYGKKVARPGAAVGRRKLSLEEKKKAMRHIDVIVERIRECGA